MSGYYSPVFCKINAEGRKTDASFGCMDFDMTVKVGPSLKQSRDFVKIKVIYNREINQAFLYLDDKLIKQEI